MVLFCTPSKSNNNTYNVSWIGGATLKRLHQIKRIQLADEAMEQAWRGHVANTKTSIHRKIYPVEAGNKWEDNGWYSMLKFALRRMNQLICISNESCMLISIVDNTHAHPCKQDLYRDRWSDQHAACNGAGQPCMHAYTSRHEYNRSNYSNKKIKVLLVNQEEGHACHPSIHPSVALLAN